jgi:hypothetical protein
MYRTLRVCSNRGGYEAIPEPPYPLDLAETRRRLEREGIAVVDARVMLIAALDAEVTISRSGRLLFKTQDAGRAESSFRRLAALLGLPGEQLELRRERSGGPRSRPGA